MKQQVAESAKKLSYEPFLIKTKELPMKIQIQTTNIKVTDYFRETIYQKILSSLDRISGRIFRVKISIKDINGPRGGADKQCCLIVGLLGIKEIVIKEVQTDLIAAITQALERGERAVRRTIDRQRRLSSCKGGVSFKGLSYYDR